MSLIRIVLAVIGLALAACSQSESPATASRAAMASVDGARIQAADSEPGSWLAHGRTYDEQRFSPLDDIDQNNVGNLGLAWHWDTNTTRGLEATPIVVDGVMYTTGSWSVVWAHDAKTGELLWEYDPMVPREWARYACCDVVNRGVAAWKGRIYSGTLDGRLLALDAATGKVAWEVLTIDKARPYTITGAPRIVDGKVIIGNGGAEYGVRGYVTAYDAASGEELWRFYTVPGNPEEPFENDAMELAASTWHGGEWWKVGGGGTVWDSMAYDHELNLLYIGVGNGSPWSRNIRSPGGGDNLFLSSIVALNPDDGSYVWHYQTTPGDSWDYTATQHMILADLELNGRSRKVIMQAPKNGFFYVLDRTNGEFISAEPYVPVSWARHIDPETGRPVENPDVHYANDARLISPSSVGGHNWHPMTYSQTTGLVYIPVIDLPQEFAQDKAFLHRPGVWNTGTDFDASLPGDDPGVMISALSSFKGGLTAWNPVTQQPAWGIQHDTLWNGGLLSTAGNLVFQGRADGYFAAYAADSGELLWEYPTQNGIIAAPVTYAVDDEQYVAVVAGWGGGFAQSSGVPRHRNNVLKEGRILVFKLGAKAELPETELTMMKLPQPPALEYTADQVRVGKSLYARYCYVCHGYGVLSSSSLPDLRHADASVHAAWDAIVRQGAFVGMGMPKFGDVLDEAQSHAVQAYVVDVLKRSIELCESEYRKSYPELLDMACTRPER